jgi:hypothetical protein
MVDAEVPSTSPTRAAPWRGTRRARRRSSRRPAGPARPAAWRGCPRLPVGRPGQASSPSTRPIAVARRARQVVGRAARCGWRPAPAPAGPAPGRRHWPCCRRCTGDGGRRGRDAGFTPAAPRPAPAATARATPASRGRRARPGWRSAGSSAARRRWASAKRSSGRSPGAAALRPRRHAPASARPRARSGRRLLRRLPVPRRAGRRPRRSGQQRAPAQVGCQHQHAVDRLRRRAAGSPMREQPAQRDAQQPHPLHPRSRAGAAAPRRGSLVARGLDVVLDAWRRPAPRPPALALAAAPARSLRRRTPAARL